MQLLNTIYRDFGDGKARKLMLYDIILIFVAEVLSCMGHVISYNGVSKDSYPTITLACINMINRPSCPELRVCLYLLCGIGICVQNCTEYIAKWWLTIKGWQVVSFPIHTAVSMLICSWGFKYLNPHTPAPLLLMNIYRCGAELCNRL